MDIFEAIELLKEIVNKCPNVNGAEFLFMLQQGPHAASQGYELVIRKELDEQTRACVNRVIEERRLSTNQQPKTLMVYQAKEAKTA